MRSSMKLMVRGAMMIALATVLSLFEVFRAPFGGSVTLGSMVPIVLFALLYDLKWATLTALAYGVLQLLLGTGNLSGLSLEAVFGAMLLDYIVAFAVLGLAGGVARRFKNRFFGAGVGTFVVMLLRFGCHFLSGLLIWDSYAPPGVEVWYYSLTYNGGYMLIEALITVTVLFALIAVLPLDKLRRI